MDPRAAEKARGVGLQVLPRATIPFLKKPLEHGLGKSQPWISRMWGLAGQKPSGMFRAPLLIGMRSSSLEGGEGLGLLGLDWASGPSSFLLGLPNRT